MDRPTPANHWVKSSLSFANGKCVEVAVLSDGRIGVRNSWEPDGVVLRFTLDEWCAFLTAVRNGEFNGLAMAVPQNSQVRDNRYSFLRWVLADPWRTLRLMLLVAVLTAAAVLAPHLLKLLW